MDPAGRLLGLGWTVSPTDRSGCSPPSCASDGGGLDTAEMGVELLTRIGFGGLVDSSARHPDIRMVSLLIRCPRGLRLEASLLYSFLWSARQVTAKITVKIVTTPLLGVIPQSMFLHCPSQTLIVT